MKRLVTSLCALLCAAACVQAQNLVTHSAVGQSPLTFVRENLGGQGVYIWNVTYNGSSSSISQPSVGTFELNGCDAVPFENGIVMSTGHVNQHEGPSNNKESASYLTPEYHDPLIESMNENGVGNCSVIEFDFVSLSNSVLFNYVFGSMEYPTYTCTQFNDVFMMLVTGVDPVTGLESTRNIALIPGSDTLYNGKYPDGIAVAINSVNSGKCSGSNQLQDGMFLEFSDYFVNNYGGYDYGGSGEMYYGLGWWGYTAKLYAEAELVPCTPYHMKMVVCNISDNGFDSGLIIEGNTFAAPNASIGLSVSGVQTVSGYCPKGMPLTLASTPFDNGTVHFASSGSAKLGEDFDIVDRFGNVLNTDGFNIDNTSRMFYVQMRQDADIDVERTFDLVLSTSLCAEFPQLQLSDTMHFRVVKGGGVTVGDTVLECSNACLKVTAPLLSGSEPITYRWEPTTGIDNPYQRTSTAYITKDADYKLIATGGTGCVADTAVVKVRMKGSEWVGIDQVEDASVAIFPNPATDAFNVSAEDLMGVELYATDGRKVLERSFSHASGTFSIGLDGLEGGVYGVRVVTGHGMNAYKIVVNK